LTTTSHERDQLLQIARDAITAHVTGGVREAAAPTGLAERRGGVFVSLHRHGELRGCIGHIESDDLLIRVVAQCAVAACSADPRFSAVTPAELHEIEIELSLLGPLEPAAGPADVEVGRHGLLIEMGRQRGLLLPQVATEWQWDAATFFAQTCRKAGLPEDSWKRSADVKVWRFEAEVFAENGERRT
jgi:AmmeMemoRadiSam system protein A